MSVSPAGKADKPRSKEASRRLYREHAYAIKIGEQWFAGFGGKDIRITKLRHGLCEAKLIGGGSEQQLADYMSRLAERGLHGVVVCVGEITSNGVER